MFPHILLMALAAFGRPVSAARAADVSLPLIEYRALGAIGQVRITAGMVHDAAVQTEMLGNLAANDRLGLTLVAGDSARSSTHSATFGSHRVETTVRVYPATGRGYRGGLGTADLIVTVDGVRRIDCPFTNGRVQMWDVSVMPGEGMVSVSGSVSGKQVDQVVFLHQGQIIDAHWLEQHAK